MIFFISILMTLNCNLASSVTFPQDTLKSNVAHERRVVSLPEIKYNSDGTINETSYQRYLAFTNPEYLNEIKNDLRVDSIGKNPIMLYLNDLKLSDMAKKFYNGEIYPTDDSITFNLLDTLTMTNSELSPFYKYIFNYICEISDGALSEVMGSYCLTAIQTNTELYIQSLSSTQLGFICYELSFSDNLNTKLMELEKIWKGNTTSRLHSRIEEIINEIKIETTEIRKEQ